VHYFLLAPLVAEPEFPFWQVAWSDPYGRPDWQPPPYYAEPMAGLIPVFPLYALGFLPVIALFAARGREWFTWVALYAAAVASAGILFTTGFLTMRYMLDFAPLFLVLAVAQATAAVVWPRVIALRILAFAVFVVISAPAIAANLAISMAGPYGDFERKAPDLYRQIANAFRSPLSPLAELNEFVLNARVVFPENPAAAREPLVTSGQLEMADFILVHYLGSSRLSIAYHKWGEPPVESIPIELTRGREHRLVIRYLRAGERLTVELDGAEVLVARTMFHPTRPEYVLFGRNRIAQVPWPARTFSGGMRVDWQRITWVSDKQ
jgi:hypothetical protein